MEKIKEGESQKREDAGARKGRKVTIHCVFPMIWGSGGSKSNLAKAAGAEPSGQMRDEKVHAAVARSTFPSQKCQKPTVSDSRCLKVHAVVARSTFPSQNVQDTPFPDHFWKFRCRKSACRCGAKHLSKSKSAKKLRGSDHFLNDQMWKKWTPSNLTNLTNRPDLTT